MNGQLRRVLKKVAIKVHFSPNEAAGRLEPLGYHDLRVARVRHVAAYGQEIAEAVPAQG